MAGNSSRRGSVKKSGKGNPTAGSGGRRRRGLEGRGPTPKAEDRPAHKNFQGDRFGTGTDKSGAKKSGAGRSGGQGGSSGRGGPSRRTGNEAEWIAGRNSVVEALREGVPVQTLYVAEGAERDGRLREAFAAAADRGIALMEVTRNELDRLTRGAVHQGLAAKIPAYEYAHPRDLVAAAAEAKEPALIVALDSVTDPRNLGAIVRSAAGFGAHGVLIPERRAAGMTASAWKTSAGAAARIPIAQATNLVRALNELKDEGCMVVGLDAAGEMSLPDLELADGPLVIVVGSEGKGLGRLVGETCDALVSIPMSSGLESLNAGVAASVALYAVSQRRA